VPHASRAESLRRDQQREFPFQGGTSDALVFAYSVGLSDQVCKWVLQSESPKGVVEASRVLQVHVVTGRAGLTVSALKEQDFFGNSSSDGGGETTLAGRDP
jgi:hypothetical protein